MNHRLIQAALLAATLAGGAAVHAQDRHDRNERNERYEQRDDDRRGDRHDNRDDRRYSDGRRNDRVDYHHDGRDDRNRGAGPRHDLRKGGRLPSDYRNRQYVVDDWRGHRLSAPPRGYHWVQTGNDYVLAAVATGVIASIILGQ
ncbi:Ni/Co efflux regulator RcnB [Pseudoduganella lurida]|uniref:Ni/Co efflux regulator RcnB n=1 Tax=Pseudoduganella lurida TaxID=1036180 RepID=A0A562R589_9BURK|nr:RcnB family protein [Pseudoduganella lurida]TWI64228.1 Ni/Co efflux regulator RcnB [Pseudoduganella lurida]